MINSYIYFIFRTIYYCVITVVSNVAAFIHELLVVTINPLLDSFTFLHFKLQLFISLFL